MSRLTTYARDTFQVPDTELKHLKWGLLLGGPSFMFELACACKRRELGPRQRHGEVMEFMITKPWWWLEGIGSM